MYISDIITSITNIEEYVQGMTLEVFIHDKKTIDAVIRNLEVIGQAARNMPQEIVAQYPEIPWKEMVSMRNKVLHEYFGVDLDILWKTIQEDLPALKKQFGFLPQLLD